MNYSIAYIQYLIQFHITRDWFECHEIMEEEWKQEADERLKPTWHMLVKLAVAQYHERRHNVSGALKLYQGFMDGAPRICWSTIGIQQETLCAMVRTCITRLEAIQSGTREGHESFTAMNLPIQDNELLMACDQACEQKGMRWQPYHGEVADHILHRHIRRDRTEEYKARQLAKEKQS